MRLHIAHSSLSSSRSGGFFTALDTAIPASAALCAPACAVLFLRHSFRRITYRIAAYLSIRPETGKCLDNVRLQIRLRHLYVTLNIEGCHQELPVGPCGHKHKPC